MDSVLLVPLELTVADESNITGWITVEHRHIPLRKGESKKQAVEKAIAQEKHTPEEKLTDRLGATAQRKLADNEKLEKENNTVRITDPVQDYKENGIRAKAFKKWFGDWEADPKNASKVVNDKTGKPKETHPIPSLKGESVVRDKDDKPIVVYHGTLHGGFNAFDEKFQDPNALFGRGFYFTENKAIADSYREKADVSEETKAVAKNINPETKEVYLCIKHPLDAVKGYTQAEVKKIIGKDVYNELSTGLYKYAFQDKAGTYLDRLAGTKLQQVLSLAALEDKLNGKSQDSDFRSYLERKGFDGITHIGGDVMGGHGGMGGGKEGTQHRVWVAFHSEQIKSVNNKGTFDPSNADVRATLDIPISLDFDESKIKRDDLGQFAKQEGNKLFNTEEHSNTPDDLVQLRLFGKVSPLQEKLQRESSRAVRECQRLLDNALEQGVEVSRHEDWKSLDGEQQMEVASKWVDDNYQDTFNGLAEERKKELVDEKDTEVRGDDDWQYEQFQNFCVEKNIDIDAGHDAFSPNMYLDTYNADVDAAALVFNDEEDKRTDDELSKEERDARYTQREERWKGLKKEWQKRMDASIEEEVESRVEKALEEEPEGLLESATESAMEIFQQSNLSVKTQAAEDAGYIDTSSRALEEPENYDPLGDNIKSDEDYKKTRDVAVYLQEQRTLEILRDRKILVRGTDINDPDIGEISQKVWGAWKGSSTSDLGLALQLAAAEELGGLHRLTKEQLEDASSGAIQLAHSLGFGGGTEASMKVLRAYVRATWEATQYVADKAGIKNLEVYRALMLPGAEVDKATAVNSPIMKVMPGYHSETVGKDGGHWHQVSGVTKAMPSTALPKMKFLRNGAASTTLDSSVANNWQGTGELPPNPVRVVLRIDTPMDAVVSLPCFGQNVHTEKEVVLAGTEWNKWDAWKLTAPKFDDKAIAASLSLSHEDDSSWPVIDLLKLEAGQPHWLSGVRKQKALLASLDFPIELTGNPNHDELGRFATKDSYAFVSPNEQNITFKNGIDNLNTPRQHALQQADVAPTAFSLDFPIELDGISVPSVRLPLPRVRQENTWSCGPACLVSIATYLTGKVLSQSAVAKLCNTTKTGTTPQNIATAASQLGIQAEVLQGMSVSDVVDQLEQGRPVIINLQAWADNPEDYDKLQDGHYVVAVDYRDGELLVMDPSIDSNNYGNISEASLESRWADKEANGNIVDHLGIVFYAPSVDSGAIQPTARVLSLEVPIELAGHDVSDEARDEKGQWTAGGKGIMSDIKTWHNLPAFIPTPIVQKVAKDLGLNPVWK